VKDSIAIVEIGDVSLSPEEYREVAVFAEIITRQVIDRTDTV